MLADLSLSIKTPLRIAALVIITAILVTAVLVVREREELRRDLVSHSGNVARVLTKTLIEPMAHDDAWRAFEIINTPFQPNPDLEDKQVAEIVLVLDTGRRIYVSTNPRSYPMLGDPVRIDPDFAVVQRASAELATSEPSALVSPASSRMYMVAPILSDGVRLGTLVMGYSPSVFNRRFQRLIQQAAEVTLLVIAVLVPGGWYFGRRIAKPLIELSGAMEKVGPQVPAHLDYVAPPGRDEIGKLGTEFERMLQELRRKEALERRMIASDRLAAIGRLTAGIAHEINNPLGGMLNAISTYRRHGPDDPMAAKTLSLIERGLLQIKETVAALLVEAKVESHPLTRQDVEDTHLLVLPDAEAKDARFEWSNELDGPLSLPSTLTRQILINLLLNAVQAARPGGFVSCITGVRDGSLQIRVANDGSPIPADKLQYLFEPFSVLSGDGHGLGLWVTYQIVQQLGGRIDVRSDAKETVFSVLLPLSEEKCHDSAEAVPG